MILILLIFFGFLAQPATSESLSSWLLTANYPYPDQYAMSCVDNPGYIYCIGGANGPSNQVFYAPLSSSGIGTWSAAANYPLRLGYLGCAASGGYVYCVGGTNGFSGLESSVYFATLSSSGVGTWTATTSYPYANSDQSCFIGSGYIYCVGGFGMSSDKDVYYASASSSGVGTWTKTGAYPVAVAGEDCVTDSFGSFIFTTYVYCIGGANNSAYFAQVGSRQGFVYSPGISAWSPTTGYPVGISGASCFVSSHYLYCVAGQTGPPYTAVYFAPLTSSGIGAWSATATYPVAIKTTECVADSGYAYCVDGYLTANSYYAQIYNIPPPFVTTTATRTSASITTLTTTQASTITSTATSTLKQAQNSVSTTTVTMTGAQSTVSASTATTSALASNTTTPPGSPTSGISDFYSLGIPIGAGIAVAGVAIAIVLRRQR